ncbi:Tetratricopeptide repeat protein 16 [Entophlyctis luteolus]|nr:Tetratricopeptide repeat protein 16 [Entophlyctis luteolus]
MGPPPPTNKKPPARTCNDNTAVQLIRKRSAELNDLALEKLFPNPPPEKLPSQNVIDAIALFSRAVFLDGSEPCFYLNRAEAYLLINDFESTIANLKKAQSLLPALQRTDEKNGRERTPLNPDSADCWRLATATTQTASAVEDSDLFFNFEKAITYIGLNKTDETIELLHKLIEDKDARNVVDLRVLRAKLNSELNAVDLVNMDVVRITQLAPAHPEVRQLMEYIIWTAIQLKNKASSHILKGQFDLAVIFLNHALELDPTDWISLLKRGTLFFEMGHFDSAIADLLKVMDIDDRDKTRDSEVRSLIGGVYNKMGVENFLQREKKRLQHYSKAKTCFESALGFVENEPVVYKNLADCFLAMCDEAEYEKALERALGLDAADDESAAKLAQLWFSRAGRAGRAGHYADALCGVSRAIALQPKTAQYWFERGRLHLLAEQLDAARADLAAALDRDPTNEDAAAILAHISQGVTLDYLKPFPAQKKLHKDSSRIRHASNSNSDLKQNDIRLGRFGGRKQPSSHNEN